MSKFIVVKQAPEKLGKGEIVINEPNFLEEIKANVLKEPKRKLTAINHLREVINTIASKYDQELNVMSIPMVHYDGLSYENDSDLNEIIIRILTAHSKGTLERVLDKQIKSRPLGTKLVYYTGSFNSTTPFYKNGLDLLEEKDLETYLTGKPKKVVGKPAITKEQAEQADEERSE